jgi:hypothetical protein
MTMKNENDVNTFLNAVKDSLYGDLENFDRLCKEAEEQENYLKENSEKIESKKINYVTPLTTTTQTTSSGYFSKSRSIEEIKYRSTIPHMMAVLSTIDLIGFLLDQSRAVRPNAEKYISNFFSLQNNSNQNNYIHKDSYKKLAIIYRNGMAHYFFPKRKFKISAHSKNPKELFFFEEGVEVLNANHLIDASKELFDKVILDSSLHDNMEMQFKLVLKAEEDIMDI